MARARRTHGIEIAGQLYELAEQLLRQRLRREQPRLTKNALEAEVNRWRRHRPGAEHGDAPGRVVAWPHRRPR